MSVRKISIKTLNNRYLTMLHMKWTRKESLQNMYDCLYEYAEEVMKYKGLSNTENSLFKFKIVDDFEKKLLNMLYESKKNEWTQLREKYGDVVKLYQYEYEIRSYAFKKVRLRLYELIDLWTIEEYEQKKTLKKEGLAGLAQDEQNVHTQAINNQTNDGLSVIRSIPVPQGQKTLDEIVNHWITTLPYTIPQISVVYEDMKKWGSTNTVIRKNDWEYRTILRGIWAKIKSYEGEMFTELLKRLWEECYESVGMCAQGHLSRLANVMVGYDESIRPSVSNREEFQTQMAEIAKKEDILENKIKEATLLMDTINMPQDERESWLEAF